MSEDRNLDELNSPASKIDEAQRKYSKSEKGKASLRRYLDSEKGKAALKKYANSEKGKEATRSASRRHYHTRKKPEGNLIKLYQAWLGNNPNGTPEEFLSTVNKRSKAPRKERTPVYHDPNWEDPTDKAKQKYFSTEKGRGALKKAQAKYYRRKTKPKNEVAKACAEWLEQNPDKTVEDYINEQSLNSR